jgi:hypothetical protein
MLYPTLGGAVPVATPFRFDHRTGQWRLAAFGLARRGAGFVPRAAVRRRSMQAHPSMQSRRPQTGPH